MRLLLFKIILAIVNAKENGKEITTLVPLESVVQNPGMIIENPTYVEIREEMRNSKWEHPPDYEKYVEMRGEPNVESYEDLRCGTETFFDRIQAKIDRNRPVIVQEYR
jgi:hypothetical protein